MTDGFRASVVWHDLADALALARPPLIAVVAPGPVAGAVRWEGAERVTARRGDRDRPGALVARAGRTLAHAGPLLALELQWADAESLDAIVDLAAQRIDRGGPPVVTVWRHGAELAALDEILLIAGAHGSVIDVVPDPVESLIARGVEHGRAAQIVAASAGLPDLVAAVERGEPVDAEVRARLAVLDAAARLAAEAAAFGGRVDPEHRRRLVVEGLLPPEAAAPMPEVVAAAVRVARGATERPPETRLLAADALLAAHRPGDAVRELGSLDSPEADRRRAAALIALGDPAAAAAAFERAGEADWAAWAATVAGQPVDRCPRPDGGEVAALVADATWRWRDGSATAEEVLATLATAARRQTLGPPASGEVPVTAAEVRVRLAERFGEHAVAARTAAAAGPTVGEPHASTLRGLAAWIDARCGLLDAAAAALDDRPLAPRAELVRSAARSAIAVRDTDAGDVEAVAVAAAAAASAVAPDLLDLDLLADVAGAVERARADELDPIAPVAALCTHAPPLRADVARARLTAAVAGDRLDRITARARELLAVDGNGDRDDDRRRDAAELRELAVLLAEPATAPPASVIDAARRLAASGAPHLAARLCGIVATASGDETTARLLLRESRTWRAARATVRRAAGAGRAVVRLSDQEQRIARLVMEGRTHKEIGAVLFVSPKTVEHHVAHIRTKLGATTRAEMLAVIGDYLAQPDPV